MSGCSQSAARGFSGAAALALAALVYLDCPQSLESYRVLLPGVEVTAACMAPGSLPDSCHLCKSMLCK